MSDEVLMTTEDTAAAFESVLSREGYQEPGHEESKEELAALAPPTGEETEEPETEGFQYDQVDAEQEEEPAPEAEPQPEAETAEQYEVLVNGEKYSVPLPELIAGYQRQSAFTQKTQALAEERRQMQLLTNEYSEKIAQVQQLANDLQTAPEIPEPAIDWKALHDEDPVAWLTERQKFNDRQQLRQQRQAQLMALQNEQKALQQQQLQSHLAQQQQQLLQLVPEWSDSKVAQNEKSQLRAFAAREYGLTDDELNTAYDARLVAMLRHAYLYRQGAEKAVQAVKPKADPTSKTQGRAYRPETNKSRLRKANDRLSKTGSIEDATAVFQEMFG